jgi:hypothetical protein
MKLKTERVLMVGGLIALTSLMWGELFPAKGSLLKEDDSKKELSAVMLKVKATFTGRMDPFRITPYVDPIAEPAQKQAEKDVEKVTPIHLSLEAILIDGRFRAAVINRQVFLEGETHVLRESVAPVTLKRVHADRVVVRHGTAEMVIPLSVEVSGEVSGNEETQNGEKVSSEPATPEP